MIGLNRLTKNLVFDKLTAAKMHYDAGFHMPMHKDNLSKISIVLEGEFSEKPIDGQAVLLGNTSIITKPNTILHENTFGKKGCTILSIQFPEHTILPPVCQKLAYHNHPSVMLLGIKIWLQLVKAKTNVEIDIVLNEFIQTIQLLQSQSSKSKMFTAASMLLKLQCRKRPVQEVSDSLSLHRGYLSRAFKEDFHIAPGAFNKKQRLIHAIQYLNKKENSLAGVAYEAGFSDQSHFTRILQKEIGCTPMELRKYLQNMEKVTNLL